MKKNEKKQIFIQFFLVHDCIIYWDCILLIDPEHLMQTSKLLKSAEETLSLNQISNTLRKCWFPLSESEFPVREFADISEFLQKKEN